MMGRTREIHVKVRVTGKRREARILHAPPGYAAVCTLMYDLPLMTFARSAAFSVNVALLKDPTGSV